MKELKVDKIFLIIVAMLVFGGFLIFNSASLGLLAKEGLQFSRAALNQIFFGLILGSLAAFFTARLEYRIWRKYALYFFISSLIMTALVFVPGLGKEHAGAQRWIMIGSVSFQPAELLKLGFVIYFAAWLSGVKTKIKDWKYGLLPLLILMSLIGTILMLQPDNGTFGIILIAGIAMFIAAGGPWKHFLYLSLGTLAGMASIAFLKPYVMSRILTFLNPAGDPLGAGYQIQQSLIAVGSGQIFGRGFGQSIQKFSFLPEPIGDSIFAVFSEEFGFIGASLLIILFIFFVLRGFKIATKSRDAFGSLMTVGIITLIAGQSFINIASMLGVVPLTGLPLIFVSHGGSAMFFALAEVGIVLNISRYQRT